MAMFTAAKVTIRLRISRTRIVLQFSKSKWPMRSMIEHYSARQMTGPGASFLVRDAAT